jgi:hypothetical protein
LGRYARGCLNGRTGALDGIRPGTREPRESEALFGDKENHELHENTEKNQKADQGKSKLYRCRAFVLF